MILDKSLKALHDDRSECYGAIVIWQFQFCANAAIYLWFLVRVGFNSHIVYNISNALPYKLTHRVSI